MFRNKTIALSMSGGVDSTMLCFLMAKSIRRNSLNSTIQPYNGFDSWAPNDSQKLPSIIQYIKEKFPTVKINDPLMIRFNTNGDQINDKNSYIQPFIENLIENKTVDIVMNGISKGPSIPVQKTFGESLPFKRRPGKHLWDEVERADSLTSPFKSIDKRFIVQCYKDFKCEDLLDLTHSCTHPVKQSCGECWWCKERKWAINEVFQN